MSIITCFDYLGNPHEVPQSEITKRESVYGVCLRDSQVLLVKSTFVMHWEFPGGGIDNGEDPLQALQREFVEETGITISTQVEPITSVQEYYYNVYGNQGWDSNRTFYRVLEEEGQLLVNGNGDDVSEAKFFEVEEALALPEEEFPQFFKAILRDAIGA